MIRNVVIEDYRDTEVTIPVDATGATRLKEIGGPTSLTPVGEIAGAMGDSQSAFALGIPVCSFRALAPGGASAN